MRGAIEGISVPAWSVGVRRDREVRRGGRSVAWALADRVGFGTAGCRATDAEIAAELGLAENTIKNAILQLGALGHIAWTWRTIRGVEVRTIRPTVAPASSDSLDQAATEDAPEAERKPVEVEAVSTEDECAEPAPTLAEVDAASTEDECTTARTKRTALPAYMLSPRRQIEKAEAYAYRLNWTGTLRCTAEGCDRPATFICADEAGVFCYSDRGCAYAPVALARFGIGPEAKAGGREAYGDFRGC